MDLYRGLNWPNSSDLFISWHPREFAAFNAEVESKVDSWKQK